MLVYHPVPRHRLTKKFFYHRNFREGVTAIELEHVQDGIYKARLLGHLRWHVARIFKLLLEYPLLFVRTGDGQSGAVARQMARISFSWGVVYWSIHLIRKVRWGTDS
jgi:hypothetical protein